MLGPVFVSWGLQMMKEDHASRYLVRRVLMTNARDVYFVPSMFGRKMMPHLPTQGGQKPKRSAR